jgi:hypothetical protein
VKKTEPQNIKASATSPDTPPSNIEELSAFLIDITKGEGERRLGTKYHFLGVAPRLALDDFR